MIVGRRLGLASVPDAEEHEAARAEMAVAVIATRRESFRNAVSGISSPVFIGPGQIEKAGQML